MPFPVKNNGKLTFYVPYVLTIFRNHCKTHRKRALAVSAFFLLLIGLSGWGHKSIKNPLVSFSFWKAQRKTRDQRRPLETTCCSTCSKTIAKYIDNELMTCLCFSSLLLRLSSLFFFALLRVSLPFKGDENQWVFRCFRGQAGQAPWSFQFAKIIVFLQ